MNLPVQQRGEESADIHCLAAFTSDFPALVISDRPRQIREAVDEILREKLQQGKILYSTALSDSMAPLIRAGDRIGVAWRPLDQLHTGDIVVTRTGRGYRVHRLLSLAADKKTLATVGDSRRRLDLPTSAEHYLGVVVSVTNRRRRIELETDIGRTVSHVCGRVAWALKTVGSPQQRLRSVVIWSTRFPGCSSVLHAVTRLGIKMATARCAQSPNVTRIFARRSFATGDYRPGLSDVDLALVCRSTSAEMLEQLWRRLRRLRRILPFLGEALVLTDEEFDFWAQFDRRGFETGDWQLLHGAPVPIPEYQFELLKFRLDILTELHHVSLLLASVLRKTTLGEPVTILLKLTAQKLLLDLVRYGLALGSQEEGFSGRIVTRTALTSTAKLSRSEASLVTATNALLGTCAEEFPEAIWRVSVDVMTWVAAQVERCRHSDAEWSCLVAPRLTADCERQSSEGASVKIYEFEHVQYLTLPLATFSALPLSTLRGVLRERDCVVSGLVVLPESLFSAFAMSTPRSLNAQRENPSLSPHLQRLLMARSVASLTALLHTATDRTAQRKALFLGERDDQFASIAEEIRRLEDHDSHDASQTSPGGRPEFSDLLFSMTELRSRRSGAATQEPFAVQHATLLENLRHARTAVTRIKSPVKSTEPPAASDERAQPGGKQAIKAHHAQITPSNKV